MFQHFALLYKDKFNFQVRLGCLYEILQTFQAAQSFRDEDTSSNPSKLFKRRLYFV
jgi:hypothetical protein